jgi:LysR family carnitine catabolism transcriptional activator
MAMTQPAFSQLVRELEHLAGTRLFERTTRRVELTEAGRVLLAQVRRPLEDLQHAHESLAELAAGRAGSVTFAILPSAAFQVGTRTVARFCADFPRVKVQQIEDQERPILHKVLNREVDFGVGMLSQADKALSFDLMFVDELVVTMRADHPCVAKPQVAWRDLAQGGLILLPPTSSVRRLVDAGLAVARCERDPTFEVINMVTALAMVREGLGMTVLPEMALDSMKMDGLVYRRFSTRRPTRRVGVIRRVDRVLSTPATTFVEYLLKHGRSRTT